MICDYCLHQYKPIWCKNCINGDTTNKTNLVDNFTQNKSCNFCRFQGTCVLKSEEVGKTIECDSWEKQ